MNARALFLLLLLLALPARADEPASDPGLRKAPDELLALALGATLPLHTTASNTIPVYYLLYYRGEEGTSPAAVFAEYSTSNLEAYLSEPLLGPLFGTGRFLGSWRSWNATPYAHRHGAYLEERSFNQSLAGGSLELGAVLGEGWTARLFTGARYYAFSKVEGASPYDRPADHTRLSVGLRTDVSRVLYTETFDCKQGWRLSVEGGYACRDPWTAWGYEDATLRGFAHAREWAWLRGRAGAYAIPLPGHNLLFDLRFGFLEDADAASAVRIGSAVGTVPLAGAAYGQLAADRYVFLRSEYSLDLWDGARLAVGLDLGAFRDLAHRGRGALGAYLTLTQKTILGMPVSLTYGLCPLEPIAGASLGHEIFLVAKAAFF